MLKRPLLQDPPFHFSNEAEICVVSFGPREESCSPWDASLGYLADFLTHRSMHDEHDDYQSLSQNWGARKMYGFLLVSLSTRPKKGSLNTRETPH